ncbi:MAG: hypothetical protein WA821_19170 [Anaerolineales bacterium]
MFRRIMRQGQQGNQLNAEQMALLVNANQVLTAGKPAEAAPLFTQLAVELEKQQHPRRAANVYARAAHAFADAQNETAALAQARKALTLFLQYRMVQRSPVFFANILRKMKAHNMNNAASAIQKEYGGQIGVAPVESQAAPSARRGVLPTQCPKCGAPVGADVNWVDERTAECDYCGTLLRAGN